MNHAQLSTHLQAIAAHAKGKKNALITGNYDCNFPLTEAMRKTARIAGDLQRQTPHSSVILVPNDLFVDDSLDQYAMRMQMAKEACEEKAPVEISRTDENYAKTLANEPYLVITERRARNRAARELEKALGKRQGESRLDNKYIHETKGAYIIDGIIAKTQTTGPACQLVLGHLLRELQDAGFEYAAGIFVGAEYPCANEAVEHIYRRAYAGTMNIDILYLPDPGLVNHPDNFKRSKANIPLQLFCF